MAIIYECINEYIIKQIYRQYWYITGLKNNHGRTESAPISG